MVMIGDMLTVILEKIFLRPNLLVFKYIIPFRSADRHFSIVPFPLFKRCT